MNKTLSLLSYFHEKVQLGACLCESSHMKCFYYAVTFKSVREVCLALFPSAVSNSNVH